MPELPEVETIRTGLQRHLPGRKIKDIRVHEPRLRWPVDKDKLRKMIGQTIHDIDRRAKYLLFALNHHYLIIHLGMSGRLLLVPHNFPVQRHDHIQIYFEDGWELRYHDPRRFGMMDVVPQEQIKNYPRFQHLGLEPLDPDTQAEELWQRAQGRSLPIKNLLMDARFIAGLGNIYTNEALYYAGIHPLTPAGNLNVKQWENLLGAIRRVLISAIKRGGTTINDFVNSKGEAGFFQLKLAVYDRAGQPCPQCQSIIERIVLSGRSTYFCPKCQVKLKG